MFNKFKCLPILLLAAFATAQAQTYPAKPIRFMVGFPPGGTNDILARSLGHKLAEQMGQQFIIENRGGANTAIASEMFARTAAPDGYTIMLNAPGHATNPSMMKLNFDSIRDFAFITVAAESQNLLVVHPSFPPRTVKELIALTKSRPPGEINYGSSGVGTTVHLSAALFEFMTGVKWTHIPYKGGGPALIDLLAGQFSLYFGNVPTVIGHVRQNRLRAIAVSGSRRSSAAPEMPTIAESGVPGYEVTTWYGVSAPAKTPRPIVDRLHSEIIKALKSPDFATRLKDQGADPVGNSPEQATAYVQSEIAKWAKVIKAAGIKGE
ncbi:MAG: tripartite tricarboxylate transporter substrate binding protein [Betaproteobacteria bacterium]|nr:tripartite tricarboxylate transporter substrate binding protein [Betaproteobacteria bacterium]